MIKVWLRSARATATRPPRSGPWRATAGAILAVVAMLASHSVAAQEDELSGPAWSLADQAYKAYEAKDFARAIAAARDAVALRPDLPRLRSLLVNSLAAAGDVAGAVAAADEAIAAGAANDELKGVRDRLAAQSAPQPKPAAPTPATAPAADPAYQAADAGYKAFARRDYVAAIASARQAVALDPGKTAYRMLLVNALAAGGRVAEAERAASEALARAPDDASVRLQRGYLRQRLGRHGPAMEDLTKALQQPGLTAAQRRSARLALADVALAAKEPARALSALAPLAGESSYDVAARRGFALQALERHDEALDAFSLARSKARTPQELATTTRGVISALVALDRKDEAKALFVEALLCGDLNGLTALDTAYLAVQVGDDPDADEYFSRADEAGQLKGKALLDAAYVAKRQFANARSESLFRRAIDAHLAGEITLDRQRLLEVRREVANVSRTWGAYASLIYGSVGTTQSPGLAIPASGGGVLQTGGEIYWRPPIIGNRNGATVEMFVRAFETLYDATGGATGPDTIQGSTGARWKPFTDHNVVFEVSRLFPIGEVSRFDWLLRAAYSTGDGGELRLDVPSWPFWQFYGEVDRYTEVHETLANAELRLGHSFRLPTAGDNLVFTPFAVVGTAYDLLLATEGATGAGAGANLRVWFRQDQYSGPASYLDFTVQYRLKLAGDERAEGWFGAISLTY